MDIRALREAMLRLATNYRWTWKTSCEDLLRSLPGAGRERHPVQTVRSLSDDQLGALLEDRGFVARVVEEAGDLAALGVVERHTVAYFSPEFGISSYAHQYAGGLGVLAGDLLKASSDLGIPLVGVGLFYHLGAFRQQIRDGVQVDRPAVVEADDIAAIDTGVVVSVPFPGREVSARVLRVEVGRVSLLLLDTRVDENTESDRLITDRLYLGSAEERLAQEMVLGVGGARALTAMGWEPEVYHVNEGHAGFLSLELLDRVISDGDLDGARADVKARVVFTTHTPVPAGITRLAPETLMPYLELWAGRWGVDAGRLWGLGADPDHPNQFSMATFCLRLARKANGVSQLHSQVSRDLFASLPEGRAITHVTNGVHARTWTGRTMQGLFDEVLGDGWDRGDATAWGRVTGIDDGRLAEARGEVSGGLVKRLAEEGIVVDPDALVVGFARRFAPYKRATLILRERERLIDLLADDSRPIHFLYAGKAHPANGVANSLLTELVGFAGSPESNRRFSFIADYDMEIGATLAFGSDIWLNNPIRLREASGTSGEKVALNGGLNLSVLDGWWAEMYDGENGWAIPSSDEDDPDRRDDEDAASLFVALLAARDEYFSDRSRFYTRIRHAWRTLGPQVTAARMVVDYQERMYRV